MRKMGFGEVWISWIAECLKSATTSVLVNGSPTSEISMTRGLRQGDPLSPLLFLIAAEGLNGLIQKAKQLGMFSGVKVGKDAVEISHLQYADDTLLVGEATTQNIKSMKFIMRIFECFSGLKVNFAKSNLIGINVDDAWLEQMALRLHCKIGKIPFIYLGLPVGANPRRAATWKPVIEAIRRKLTSWKPKLLSLGSRIVLLKSVLSSLPTYYLSLFKAPKKVIKKIISLQRIFLWGGSEESRKIPWVAWDKVCREKTMGGLGVRRIEEFNFALLGKWRWYMLENNVRLWKVVLKSLYGSIGMGGETGLREGKFSTGSKWWVDLGTVFVGQGNRNWFGQGVEKIVGNGRETMFWHDIWVNDAPLSTKFCRLYNISTGKQHTIEQMGEWIGNTWTWKLPWRRRLFIWEQTLYDELMDEIQNIQISKDKQDSWRWKQSKDGIYSVKSAYSVLTSEPNRVAKTCYNLIWNNSVPLKVSGFSWQLLEKKLPTRGNLAAKNISLRGNNASCPLCGDCIESEEHVFFTCNFATAVWKNCSSWWGVSTARLATPTKHLMQQWGMFNGEITRSI